MNRFVTHNNPFRNTETFLLNTLYSIAHNLGKNSEWPCTSFLFLTRSQSLWYATYIEFYKSSTSLSKEWCQTKFLWRLKKRKLLSEKYLIYIVMMNATRYTFTSFILANTICLCLGVSHYSKSHTLPFNLRRSAVCLTPS